MMSANFRGRGDRRPQNAVIGSGLQPNWNLRTSSFDDLHLKPDLAHGIFSCDYKIPSEIQQLAIQPIIERKNVIAQAQSGTGKKSAFSIGILQRIDTSKKETQTLVLSPTRELADQIYDALVQIGSKMRGLSIELFTCRSNIKEQEKASIKPHIVISTPNISQALFNDGFLKYENLSIVCLAEADKLLQNDFIVQTQNIFHFLNPNVQILLFSATIPYIVFQFMEQFMHNPIKILVKAEQLKLEGIPQYFIDVGQPDFKWNTLIDFYGSINQYL